jgi:sulfatase modifying factor 1
MSPFSRSCCVAAALTAAAIPIWLALARADEDAPRRFALLIGVKDYKGTGLSSLKYTENDAHDLADVLRRGGFRRVVVLSQRAAFEGKDKELFPTAANIRLHLRSILEDRKPGDTVLVSFSGHGAHLKKRETLFFCPEGAKLDDPATLVSLDDVYAALKASKAGVRVLFADACRNDPLEGKAAGDERLESVTRPLLPDPPDGVAAIFSCSKGQKSYESDTFKHGFFSHYLIEALGGKKANRRGEVDLLGLVQFVQDEVPEAVKEAEGAGARQVPEPLLGVRGRIVLAQSAAVELAKEITNSIGLKLVRVQAGTFQMGSADDDSEAYDDEKPRHEVTIGKGFYLGKHEVTRGQFRKFVEASGYETEAERDGKGGGYDADKRAFFSDVKGRSWKDPGFDQTDAHPVVNVTWNDAKRFCTWLSDKEGKRYDLPTEAEWEYACRAGTSTRYSFGDDAMSLEKHANVADRSLKVKWDYSNITNKDFQKAVAAWFERVTWDDGYPFTAPVGQFRPNQMGLCDMHGNVWEWCQDWYDKDYYAKKDKNDPEGPSSGDARVLRGGSFDYNAWNCRAAFRHRLAPADRSNLIGFRVRLRLD